MDRYEEIFRDLVRRISALEAEVSALKSKAKAKAKAKSKK